MFPFFPLPAKVSFQWVFGAQGLMTTCFPTDMFNQRLIRGGTDTFSSPDLIFHFAFWCLTFITLPSRGEETGPEPLFERCWMFVRSELLCQPFAASFECFHCFCVCPSLSGRPGRGGGREGGASHRCIQQLTHVYVCAGVHKRKHGEGREKALMVKSSPPPTPPQPALN